MMMEWMMMSIVYALMLLNEYIGVDDDEVDDEYCLRVDAINEYGVDDDSMTSIVYALMLLMNTLEWMMMKLMTSIVQALMLLMNTSEWMMMKLMTSICLRVDSINE